MKKWLFLDIDEVVSTYRHAISIGEEGGVRQSLDDTGMRLIERAIEGHGVYLVISSAWRFCQAEWNVRYFANRFRAEGYMEVYRALNRTVELFGKQDDKRAPGWSTGPRLNTREQEVDSYINTFCQNDCVVVIDDGNLQLKTTTGFVHVTTPLDGISTENYIKMREIYDAGVSNVIPFV